MDRASGLWSSLRKSAGRGLAVLGGASLVSSALLAYVESQARQATSVLPAEFVLKLDLQKQALAELVPISPLALLTGDLKKIELSGVSRALAAARDDQRVRGLLTVLGDREHLGGTAMVQELRDAVSRFRLVAASRAPTVAFSASFGEAGANGLMSYYLASASEQVYMQRTGLLGVAGFAVTEMFVRPLLDRLRVQPQFLVREEYKSFANRFKESGFTAPHREQVTTMLQDISRQVLSHIAVSRNLLRAKASIVAEGSVRPGSEAPPAAPADGAEAEQAGLMLSYVDRAPLPAAVAVDAGLLTGLRYCDQIDELFLKSDDFFAKETVKAATPTLASRLGKAVGTTAVKKELQHIDLERYLQLVDAQRAAELQKQSGGWLSGTAFSSLRLLVGGGQLGATGGAALGCSKVAVVTATGVIVQEVATQGGSQAIEATKMCTTLEKLREDSDVAAVVLRISSGGGSALASDALHHALLRLKESGKKLIVSMGDVAASGGYMMAVAGDRILAQPATITGSIGVVFGKFNVEPLLQDLGINVEIVEVGANASANSMFAPFSEAQLASANNLIDDIYLDFMSKVAEGRKMDLETVRGLAKGQIYTGRQALAAGLIDQLGGLDDAIAAARAAADLPDDAPVYDYPSRGLPPFLALLKRSMMPPSTWSPVVAAVAAWVGPTAWPDGLPELAGALFSKGATATVGGIQEAQLVGQSVRGCHGTVLCFSPEAQALAYAA